MFTLQVGSNFPFSSRPDALGLSVTGQQETQ